MPRRVSRAIVVFGLGLALLVAGLLALARMVIAERADARASLAARQRLARDYATMELGERLATRLAQTRVAIERHLDDPLAPCPRCFYKEGSTQLVPRLGPQRPEGEGTTVGHWLGQLAGAGVPEGDDDTWRRRVSLLRACKSSPSAASELLAHRGRFVLPIEQELASALAMVDACPFEPEVKRALVGRGIETLGGRRVDGLQPLVLRNLHLLARADADLVVAETRRVSRAAGVSAEDFDARLAEMAPAPLDVPTAPAGGPLLLASGGGDQWYLEPTPVAVRGARVELGAILADIASEMRRRSILEADDRIDVPVPGRLVPLTGLPLVIESPGTRRALAALERRFALKLGFLGLAAAMGITLALLAFALQQRRRRLVELKAEFVAAVSHELRTPLASMRVLAETLARRTQGVPDARDYPARLLRDIDGMSFLVENILSFNRLTRGRSRPRSDTVSVSELVTSACDDARERSARPVALAANVGDASLRGDPELLRLLFRNLAVNAVSYNERDPEIRVDLRSRPDRGVEVLFRDNGVGIATEEREAVFEDFHRGKAAAMARGTGLGLALCRRIMALHGGTIAVADSDAGGTTFSLRFP